MLSLSEIAADRRCELLSLFPFYLFSMAPVKKAAKVEEAENAFEKELAEMEAIQTKVCVREDVFFLS